MGKREKNCMILSLMCLSLLFSFSLVSGALGISPAKQVVHFQPDKELDYTFKVFGDEGEKIEMYSAEEFADLVQFDKKEIIGSGEVNVKIKLPSQIDKPGAHRIIIGAREKVDAVAGFGTGIAVQAPIIIEVPYPGKYAEISFSTENVNVGEPVKFTVVVSSKGEEDILPTVNVEIYSEEKKIDLVEMGSKAVASQTEKTFIGFLDTSNYKPGDYLARAVVNYDEGVAKADKEFRLGRLFVNITNYTKEIFKQGIQPFNIDIESLWNNHIDNVFAEVKVYKNGETVSSVVTPSVELDKWQEKTLIGYLNTENLRDSEYDTEILVKYEKNMTLLNGKLRVKKVGMGAKVYILIIAGTIVFLAVVFYILRTKILNKFHNGKKKKKN